MICMQTLLHQQCSVTGVAMCKGPALPRGCGQHCGSLDLLKENPGWVLASSCPILHLSMPGLPSEWSQGLFLPCGTGEQAQLARQFPVCPMPFKPFSA